MSIDDFLDSLPADRRRAIETVRETILAHLPPGYEEVAGEKMVIYQVPLKVYPDTYNKQPLMYAALGSQKGHMAVYMCNAYGVPALRQRLEEGFRAAGKKLDMGAACVRFKRLEDLPLDVIGEIIGATPMQGYIDFARSVHSKEARATRRQARVG